MLDGTVIMRILIMRKVNREYDNEGSIDLKKSYIRVKKLVNRRQWRNMKLWCRSACDGLLTH